MVASRLAVDVSLRLFRETEPSTPEYRLLWRIFSAANTSIYDARSGARAGRGGASQTLRFVGTVRAGLALLALVFLLFLWMFVGRGH